MFVYISLRAVASLGCLCARQARLETHCATPCTKKLSNNRVFPLLVFQAAAADQDHGKDQLRLSSGLDGDLPPLQQLRYLAPEVVRAILDGKVRLVSSKNLRQFTRYLTSDLPGILRIVKIGIFNRILSILLPPLSGPTCQHLVSPQRIRDTAKFSILTYNF